MYVMPSQQHSMTHSMVIVTLDKRKQTFCGTSKEWCAHPTTPHIQWQWHSISIWIALSSKNAPNSAEK
jgi:hypothetical protein